MPESYAETYFALFFWCVAFEDQNFEIAMCVVKSETTTLHFPARAASGLQDAWCIVGAFVLWVFHEKREDMGERKM